MKYVKQGLWTVNIICVLIVLFAFVGCSQDGEQPSGVENAASEEESVEIMDTPALPANALLAKDIEPKQIVKIMNVPASPAKDKDKDIGLKQITDLGQVHILFNPESNDTKVFTVTHYGKTYICVLKHDEDFPPNFFEDLKTGKIDNIRGDAKTRLINGMFILLNVTFDKNAI